MLSTNVDIAILVEISYRVVFDSQHHILFHVSTIPISSSSFLTS